MSKMRFLFLSIVVAGQAFPADLLVRELSYSDATVLFSDKALTKPRVEVALRGGKQKVKGHLTAFTAAGLFIAGRGSIPLCTAESIQVAATPGNSFRRGLAITTGTIAGLTAATSILARVPLTQHTAPVIVPAALVGLPALGGWAGAKLSGTSRDRLYLLRSDGNDLCGERRDQPKISPQSIPPGETTPLLLPLQPSQL